MKKIPFWLEMTLVTLFSILFVIALMIHANKEHERKLTNPEIAVIDGCEYILTRSMFSADKYEHKANCKNHKK